MQAPPVQVLPAHRVHPPAARCHRGHGPGGLGVGGGWGGSGVGVGGYWVRVGWVGGGGAYFVFPKTRAVSDVTNHLLPRGLPQQPVSVQLPQNNSHFVPEDKEYFTWAESFEGRNFKIYILTLRTCDQDLPQ